MIRNYFKIALRQLRKNKLYAAVNIVGLAVGIASCLLIGLYIGHEESFDRFHKNADRIVRVTWEYQFEDKPNNVVWTGTKAGPEFKRAFPEVEAFVRTFKFPRMVQYGTQTYDEEAFFYADSAFFTAFSFPLLKGDAASVLAGPDKVVITQSAAKKYFGAEDPVGKTLKVGVKNFLITGLAADAPDNSGMRFDFVATFTSLRAAKEEKWNEANYVTYLLLKEGSDYKTLQAKIDDYSATVLKKEMQLNGNAYSRFHLEPLPGVHLGSSLAGFEPNGNKVYVYVLGVVALLILLIACVNYTNLSTAQSAGRSAEVGMRKVFGADRRQVFYQFISESVVLTFFSILLGLALSVLLLPYFNQLSGKAFTVSVFYKPQLLAALLVLGFVIALAAGTYPSLVLSAERITNILKKGFRFTGSGALRKTLIVFQFVISLFLMVATAIVLQQLSYIKNKDLGYDKERIVVLPLDSAMKAHYDDLKRAFMANANVQSIGGAYEEPVDVGWSDGLNKGSDYSETGRIAITALPVDEDFVKTLGLRFAAGGNFTGSDLKDKDTSNGGKNQRLYFMLNETAAKALGWTPQQAVGQTVIKGASGPVRAVVKDFHFRSLHETVGPLAIFLNKDLVNTLFVKVSGNVPAALSFLERAWKERVPHRSFEYHFLDESYAALYKAEQKTAGIFGAFAAVAIALACLSLFALTAYAIVQRTKEIGIRKILGASVPNILSLVAKDFLKLVAVAIVVATPLTWYAGSKWLENFAYRVSLHWWVFALAGGLAMLIAFATVSLQAIKAALANPVKSLRTE